MTYTIKMIGVITNTIKMIHILFVLILIVSSTTAVVDIIMINTIMVTRIAMVDSVTISVVHAVILSAGVIIVTILIFVRVVILIRVHNIYITVMLRDFLPTLGFVKKIVLFVAALTIPSNSNSISHWELLLVGQLLLSYAVSFKLGERNHLWYPIYESKQKLITYLGSKFRLNYKVYIK